MPFQPFKKGHKPTFGKGQSASDMNMSPAEHKKHMRRQAMMKRMQAMKGGK